MHEVPANPAVLPGAASVTTDYPVRFLGSGSEYFRIWIVNLLLTILTLGIYSAWAKVRRLKYMYRNTQIDGTSFDYHGSPIAILKGRLIALVLLVAYNYSFQLSLTAGLVTIAVLAIIFPWLIRQSLRFRLRYSSYRGIRFRFAGTVGELYWIAAPLLIAILPGVIGMAFVREIGEPPNWSLYAMGGILTLYFALLPYLHFRFKRYQHGNSFFGSTPVSFTATAGDFYAVYGIVLLIALAIAVIVGAVGFAAGYSLWGGDGEAAYVVFMAALLLFYALFLIVFAAFIVLLQNRIWNNTVLGEVKFRSLARIGPMTRIYFVNIVLLILTLGLFTPFAVIRTFRYRLESVTAVTAAGMDHFLSDVSAEEVNAAGEGAADLFDIDIGL
ncbi:MAG: DUF898 domain-containing protein [Burkholderiaceae bacterium]|nr:DUF898 domain-containing protein [Burkholderiaceae bacterium]